MIHRGMHRRASPETRRGDVLDMVEPDVGVDPAAAWVRTLEIFRGPALKAAHAKRLRFCSSNFASLKYVAIRSARYFVPAV